MIVGFKLMSQLGIDIADDLVDRFFTDIDSKIKDDKVFDVISGAAGMMFATTDKNLLEKLTQHLLEHYPDPRKKPESINIKTVDNASMVGFSHGVSGINVALARANQHIHNPKVDAWLQQSLDCLDDLYEKHGYWPDVRQEELQKGPLCCHGAAGVAECYLQLLDTHATEQVERGLRRAIEQVQIACDEFMPGDRAHYCCGYLGAHNFILNAHLKRPDLVPHGRLQHENVRLLSYLEQYGYDDFAIGDGYDMSFLYGYSGLAYHLMRIAYPEALPSVLTLQSDVAGQVL